jgi:hypothetical protein
MMQTHIANVMMEVTISCAKGSLTPVYGRMKGEIAQATKTTPICSHVYFRFWRGLTLLDSYSPLLFARRRNSLPFTAIKAVSAFGSRSSAESFSTSVSIDATKEVQHV